MMPSFSSLLGNDIPLDVIGSVEDETSLYEPPNLYCLNAAISACEKGGAWVEALQLYENIRTTQTENSTKPNFITVNSIIIALEKAGQSELAMSIYEEAVRDRIVRPLKFRTDNDGVAQRMLVSFIIVS
jgi:pentatricopeptide repeat protein